ncbi:hypothetical protein CN946_12455 [Bacillus sp. AFS053548]|nr:hypothetical protein CN946_12455 [Bacillus sp. AFS053548]
MFHCLRELVGGVNQYKNKHELQSWSIFFEVKVDIYFEKDGHRSLNKTSGRFNSAIRVVPR